MLLLATLVSLLAFMPLAVQANGIDLAELSDEINQCIDRQFADDATPAILEQINLPDACPSLAGSLAGNSEFISVLSPDWDSNNLAELADLRYFIAHMRYPAPSRVELELSSLPGILDDALQDVPLEPQTSWWKQLIDWLLHRDPTDRDDADFRWLENLLEKMAVSASTAKTILYTSAFLIAALALALIWHEVRLGGASGRSLFRRRSARNIREENLYGLADTMSVNPDKLPASLPELLNVCIDHLISWRRLPERKSQTNHEFLRYLQARDDAVAPQFGTLCQQAERVLYGGHRPDPTVVKRCLDEASSLLSTAMPAESTP